MTLATLLEGRKSIPFLSSLLVIGVLSTAVPAIAGMTFVYSFDSETGRFLQEAAYDVAPSDAFTAFAAGQVPESPGGRLYHNGGAPIVSEVPTTISTPADGLDDFLASHYTEVPDALLPPCDDNIDFQYILECPFECMPDPAACNEDVWVSFTIVCQPLVPCPEGFVCQDFPERLVGVVTDLQACFCDPTDFCAQDEEARVVNIISDGPLCECVPLTGTESSAWGRVKELFR
jgi:hypothetical protein